ncbi:MAG: hypothetical protein OXE99_01655 [Cellvibrionales bacterium]|nr:hypothetical protein [Cellvibrionales bacterium]
MAPSLSSKSSVHAAVLAKSQAMLEMQPLVAGSVGLAERTFMDLLNKEAEQTSMESGAFQQKFSLFIELLQSLRPSACYVSRGEFLMQIKGLIPNLSALWYASTLDKTLTQLYLSELAYLHKSILMGIQDGMFEAAMGEAKSYHVQRKASLGPKYVGLWLDWVNEEGKQRCQVVAFLRQRDQFVIANAKGEKVGDLHFEQFEELIRQEQIQILENNSQFGQALAAVIDGIREN